MNDRFGILGLDRRFRELPVGAADACGAAPAGSAVQVGARAAVGRGTMTARTLVVGIAGPEVASVALDRGGRLTPLRLGQRSAFLAVLVGLPDAVRPHLRVTDDAGHARTIKLSDSGADETPDPDRGVPWAVVANPAQRFVHLQARGAITPHSGTTCVQAVRESDPTALIDPISGGLDLPRTPIACRAPGEDAPVVASMLRLVPSAAPGTQEFAYGTAPARTVALGLASADVVRLQLRTPSRAIPVRMFGAHHAFAVIRDGREDPRTWQLAARLRSGRLVVSSPQNATFISGSGQGFSLPIAPPWVDAKAVIKALGDGTPTAKTAGSDALGPRVADPAGGPAWAAHSWLATDQRSSETAAQRGTPLMCATFGPVVDGVVREPRGAGVGPGVPSGREDTNCVESELTGDYVIPGTHRRIGLGSSPHVYVDDPASPSPRLARVVMAAVFPGVVRAEVLGAPIGGAPLPATVGPHGSVLAILPPRWADAARHLRFRLHYASGTARTTSYNAFAAPKRPRVARAVDPKGGAGWSVRGAVLGEPSIPGEPSQVVDGRLVRIDGRTGRAALTYGSSIGPRTPRTATHPIWFNQEVTFDALTSPPQLEEAEITRRTLPGRTIIYGVAAKGVRQVTIHTPRDVRTLRPASGGLFIAVYDGRFTQGRITVSAAGPGIHGVAQQPADELMR